MKERGSKMKKLVMGLLVGIFLLVGNLGYAENPKVLRWALIPAGEGALERELFQPIADYLEDRLGIPVKMPICSDFAAVIQALKFGHAEMGRVGGFGYILAKSQMEVEPLVRDVKKSTGKDYYYSLIITQRYSDIQTLQDLKGKSFAFVDPGSTSGCLVPKTILIKAGFDLETDLGKTFYSGSHGATIMAVKNNKIDAGAVADNRLLDAIEKGVVTESELVVIHRSKPICGALMIVPSDLPEEFKEKLRKAFLEMPKDLALNSGVKCLGYVPAKDEDYDPLREITETLGLELAK